ncbi:hypothetical protein CP533_1342 [Ophiocordyceps camponoti-saundersi (nom. inval.)]|nr:hypothetical protein CP533_1342 [Ophiocordyceps camponoti-saundersi (nom. inval.)]
MARSRKTPLPSQLGQPSGPTRFRCKVGGEWLPLASFSNAQQKLVQRRGGSINPTNSGMTCRDHSAASRSELRCDLCNLIKPISEFSKNNRQSDDHMCKRCSAWDETQEPHVTPSPLETGHRSIEEMNHEAWPKQFNDSADFFDDDLPRAPITDLASLGLEDDEGIKARLRGMPGGESNPEALSQLVSSMLPADDESECSGASQASCVPSLPPHLRTKQKENPAKAVVSDASSAESTINYSSSAASVLPSLPPHLRGRAMKGNGSGGRAEDGKVTYNAYAPDGKLHQGAKSMTVQSTTSSRSVSSSMMTTTDASGWPTTTTVNPWIPNKTNNHKNDNQGKSRKKGGWAKPPRLSRTELRQYDPCMSMGVKHIDPVEEEALQMGYCESEDSKY